MSEQIYEADEYCAVCLGTDALGMMTLPGDPNPPTFCVCEPCHNDKEKMMMWLAGEFEKALESSPNHVKGTDGKWLPV